MGATYKGYWSWVRAGAPKAGVTSSSSAVCATYKGYWCWVRAGVADSSKLPMLRGQKSESNCRPPLASPPSTPPPPSRSVSCNSPCWDRKFTRLAKGTLLSPYSLQATHLHTAQVQTDEFADTVAQRSIGFVYTESEKGHSNPVSVGPGRGAGGGVREWWRRNTGRIR